MSKIFYSKIHTDLISFVFDLRSQLQDLSLPPLQNLEKSLTTFTELERNAQLKSYDRTKFGDWADLLPSLGVAYTSTSDPRLVPKDKLRLISPLIQLKGKEKSLGEWKMKI